MKIGILTFHFAYNYGAMLQTYALKQFLEKEGHDVVVVDYASEHMRRSYHLRLRSFLRPTNWGWMWRRGSLNKLFESFCRVQFGSQGTTPDYAQAMSGLNLQALVVGSDQVWNDGITRFDEAYFLPLENGRTIAYAASFGRSELSPWQRDVVRRRLPLFDRVSVREPDGVDAVKSVVDVDVTDVLDPVFLLSQQEWLSAVDSPVASERNGYILYYPSRKDPLLEKKVRALSEKENLPVYGLDFFGVRKSVGEVLPDVAPLDFVRLIRHAKYVCTQSFHATAFSVLMGTNLVYMPYSDKETRASSLLQRIGAESCCTEKLSCGGGCYALAGLDLTQLKAEITKSKAFLAQALSV